MLYQLSYVREACILGAFGVLALPLMPDSWPKRLGAARGEDLPRLDELATGQAGRPRQVVNLRASLRSSRRVVLVRRISDTSPADAVGALRLLRAELEQQAPGDLRMSL